MVARALLAGVALLLAGCSVAAGMAPTPVQAAGMGGTLVYIPQALGPGLVRVCSGTTPYTQGGIPVALVAQAADLPCK